MSLTAGSSAETINVTIKVVWPSETLAQEFNRGSRGREAVLEVQVRPSMTVSAVKVIVQDREDVPLERQQLVFGGQKQEDARTLESIGVAGHGHTLFVTVTSGVPVFLKELDGTQHTVNIHLSDSVAVLKAEICKLKSWGADAVRLLYAGKQLAPDSASLSSFHVQKHSVIFIIVSAKTYQLDADVLDASWDYDFTKIKDTNKKFERAPGFEYRRPCGWFRCALKVKGKYGEDQWLGGAGDREKADADEWPVSYHATASAMVGVPSDIAAEGYKASRGMRFPFSSSIYTTPDPRLAARYAQKFEYNGDTWQIMFQNRVNPKTLERVASERAGAEYWLSASAEDVRPYGFLIRKAPVYAGEGKWVCETDQGSKEYSKEDAAALEEAFVLGVPRVVPVRKGENEVNLDSMKQINVKTRVERHVTRR